MGISGNLKTMALAELLQWLSMGQKNGTLRIDSKKVTKKIFFEKGVIISSASTDPNEYLGRFLVNHGYIPEDQVNEAIKRQKEEKKLLGSILVEMGLISSDDLDQMLRLKAEESIYDVFTWEEAAFEFFDNELPSENFIRMELDVQWIVLEGTRRTDEWNRIKELVPSEHCVPVIVVDISGLEIEELDRRILEWIDDDRSIEEISQGAQVALFQVSGTVASATQQGWVKVVRPRTIEVEVYVPAPAAEEAEDAPTAKASPPKGDVKSDSGVFYMPMMPGQPPMPIQMQQLQQLYAMQGMMQGMNPAMNNPGYPMMPGMMPGQMPMQGQMPGQMPMQAAPMQAAPMQGQMPVPMQSQVPAAMPAQAAPAVAPSPPIDLGTGRTLHFATPGGVAAAPAAPLAAAPPPASEAERLIQEGDAALAREDFELALQSYRKAKIAPGVDALGERQAKAGEEKIDQALERLGITMTAKPKLRCDMSELTKLAISPQEGYMLTRVDGTYDIKSILKIVPLSKVEAKLLFYKLRKSGHVSV
jgi:hypothetical protein